MKHLPGVLFLCLLIAGCGDDDPGFLPLSGEYAYVYDVQVQRGDRSERLKQIIEISGPFDYQNQSLYIRNHSVVYRDVLRENSDGVYLTGDLHGADLRRFEHETLLLPARLEVGDTWNSYISSELLEWRKHALEHADKSLKQRFSIQYECVSLDETVATPAGTFHNVARIEGSASHVFELGAVRDRNRITIEVTHWYAPGVGLVKSHRKETADTGLLIAGEAVMTLAEYH